MEKEKGKVFFERLRYPLGNCEYCAEHICHNRAVWKICSDTGNNKTMRVCGLHAYFMGLKEWLEEN